MLHRTVTELIQQYKLKKNTIYLYGFSALRIIQLYFICLKEKDALILDWLLLHVSATYNTAICMCYLLKIVT